MTGEHDGKGFSQAPVGDAQTGLERGAHRRVGLEAGVQLLAVLSPFKRPERGVTVPLTDAVRLRHGQQLQDVGQVAQQSLHETLSFS